MVAGVSEFWRLTLALVTAEIFQYAFSFAKRGSLVSRLIVILFKISSSDQFPLITSPFLTAIIFPEGIKVGTVESYEQKSGEPFLTVKVKLVTDFKKLNYVFVIKNKFKVERDSLESATQMQNEK